ncbi:hypothetical protein H2198_006127 [Neophaeococcomyces mojaviensis]|uniref:Uncharacterized protein n=1 Tax=Neophaeococcomyces mojaviensis TaxID=3383035 RepID=A0ACC3A4B1_9EURO|nr:hypothetical protein H2198_006127 [Knufia sp. JES_112]
MPPRISSTLAVSTFNLTSLFQALPASLSKHPDSFTKCSTCLFSTTSTLNGKRKGRKRSNQRIDPYRRAQALQRKTANLERRRVLHAERESALGDPVRSKPTTFLASLNLSSDPNAAKQHRNYFLTPESTSTQLEHSKWLTEPLQKQDENPVKHEQRLQTHQIEHTNATRAIETITSIQNSNSKDRTRINIERCIETFGRHNTDSTLPPKPASLGPSKSNVALDGEDAVQSEEQLQRAALIADLAAVPKRAGPDTGSSEVQVAILTTKINVLADNLGKKDKHNKRNLRLLVHKRQKLLSYLRQKERGGPRWQNLVEQLGINDAMWKGEISL